MTASKLTNHQVLVITTVLFAAFCAAEVIGALAGNSLALLGDASAMMVDVLTVYLNLTLEMILLICIQSIFVIFTLNGLLRGMAGRSMKLPKECWRSMYLHSLSWHCLA
jgi:hypothetical protein